VSVRETITIKTAHMQQALLTHAACKHNTKPTLSTISSVPSGCQQALAQTTILS